MMMPDILLFHVMNVSHSSTVSTCSLAVPDLTIPSIHPVNYTHSFKHRRRDVGGGGCVWSVNFEMPSKKLLLKQARLGLYISSLSSQVLWLQSHSFNKTSGVESPLHAV